MADFLLDDGQAWHPGFEPLEHGRICVCERPIILPSAPFKRCGMSLRSQASSSSRPHNHMLPASVALASPLKNSQRFCLDAVVVCQAVVGPVPIRDT